MPKAKSELTDWKQRAPLEVPRAGCAVGVVGDNVLVAGGTYWREGQKIWDVRADLYDPATDRWQPLAPLPQPRADVAALAAGDAFYIFGGGADGPAVAAVLCHQGGAWRELPRMALPAPRRSSAAVLLDGTFYLLGGFAGTGGDYASATTTLWAATPGSAWRVLAPMPGPARFLAAVGALGGRLIVAGGCTPEDGKVRNLDEVLSYDVRNDQWSTLGRLPSAFRGACGVVVGDRLLVFGGYADKFLSQILSVDPVTGESKVVGELPVGVADTRFFLVGSDVIGVTGENGIKMRFPDTIVASLAE